MKISEEEFVIKFSKIQIQSTIFKLNKIILNSLHLAIRINSIRYRRIIYFISP